MLDRFIYRYIFDTRQAIIVAMLLEVRADQQGFVRQKNAALAECDPTPQTGIQNERLPIVF
jgi:hypothetical protein